MTNGFIFIMLWVSTNVAVNPFLRMRPMFYELLHFDTLREDGEAARDRCAETDAESEAEAEVEAANAPKLSRPWDGGLYAQVQRTHDSNQHRIL